MNEEVRALLEAAAEGRLPCRQCGKPHEMRDDLTSLPRVTWADPADGHPYQQETSDEFAQRLLSLEERVS